MSAKTISLIGAALFVGAMIYLADNHDMPSQIYTCDGFTSLNGAPAKQDQGRLQFGIPCILVSHSGNPKAHDFSISELLAKSIGFKTIGEGN